MFIPDSRVIKKIFWDKTSKYVYWKIKENFTNGTYNRTSTYNRNLRVGIFEIGVNAYDKTR